MTNNVNTAPTEVMETVGDSNPTANMTLLGTFQYYGDALIDGKAYQQSARGFFQNAYWNILQAGIEADIVAAKATLSKAKDARGKYADFAPDASSVNTCHDNQGHAVVIAGLAAEKNFTDIAKEYRAAVKAESVAGVKAKLAKAGLDDDKVKALQAINLEIDTFLAMPESVQESILVAAVDAKRKLDFVGLKTKLVAELDVLRDNAIDSDYLPLIQSQLEKLREQEPERFVTLLANLKGDSVLANAIAA